jgi:osmoprotectant transport system permease protein
VLSNTYAGVQSVDPAARDAAKGMGMTGSQVLWRVEVPNALPLILSGIRSATLQIVATATIAAYVSLGGLGRFIIDGRAQRDYPQMAAGAVLVGLLAVILDLLMAALQVVVVSRGLTGRYARTPRGGRTDPGVPIATSGTSKEEIVPA